MRTAVSKKKVRFVDKPNNIDLDLTFIVDARAADSSKPYSIIAMGFPSSGLEAQYRNPLSQVQKFFEIYSRPGDYCVYNLCSERDYASMDVFSRIVLGSLSLVAPRYTRVVGWRRESLRIPHD